jgi:glucose/arabinose dehydrogenase
VRVEGRPCDARRLPNGTTLVAAHRAGRLVELDVAGNEIWVAEGIEDPQSAQRLPSGNTLIAMSKPGVVREIDRAGRVVWQKQGFRIPVDAQRLPDGSTLVQEQQGDLVEFDALGSEVSRTSTGGSRFLRY